MVNLNCICVYNLVMKVFVHLYGFLENLILYYGMYNILDYKGIEFTQNVANSSIKGIF